jgi:sugar phosphate isomerase/epimerase
MPGFNPYFDPANPLAATFGVSEFTTMPWSFAEDVERYRSLGIRAVELVEEKLGDMDVSEIQARLADAGLTVTSVQPRIHSLFPNHPYPEPAEPSVRMERLRACIDRYAELAHGAPFITITGAPPNGNIADLIDIAACKYRSLADFASQRGARIALEPLNPALMNVDTAICTLSDALKIVEAVDRENFGICVDTWNIWQEANVQERIRQCANQIFIVQLSDWHTPQSYYDRGILGCGVIPTDDLLAAVHDTGYRGPYVLEIFSRDVPDSLWQGDMESVIRQSRATFEEAFHPIWACSLSTREDPELESLSTETFAQGAA